MDMRIAKVEYLTSSHSMIKYTYYTYDAGSLSRRGTDVGRNVMATYDRRIGAQFGVENGYTDLLYLTDHTIYGSGRIGVENSGAKLADRSFTIEGDPEIGTDPNYGDPTQYDREYTYRLVGDKNYELSNHLGNVLAVITDRKIELGTSNIYSADVVSYSDYSPYGTMLPHRHGQAAGIDYRYGFGGMEADDDVKGEGNSYTTEFRQYDTRIGRWLSLDPLMANFPWQSPYVAFDNNPIYYNDPKGAASNGPGDPDKIPVSSTSSTTSQTSESWNKTVTTMTTTTISTTFSINTESFTTTKSVKTTTFTKDKITGDFSASFGEDFEIASETHSYLEVTGSEFNPFEVELQGLQTTTWYKGLSEEQQDKIWWSLKEKAWDYRSPKEQAEFAASRAQMDKTVMAWLPWYQIARGIEEVQAGNNWGWLRIGLQIVPLPPLGKIVSPVIRLEVNMARVTVTMFEQHAITAMWNPRVALGLGYRYTTATGRILGFESHTFGAQGLRKALIPTTHFHYGQAGAFSVGNHLPLYTPIALGYKQTRFLIQYGLGEGYRRTATYGTLMRLKF